MLLFPLQSWVSNKQNKQKTHTKKKSFKYILIQIKNVFYLSSQSDKYICNSPLETHNPIDVTRGIE